MRSLKFFVFLSFLFFVVGDCFAVCRNVVSQGVDGVTCNGYCQGYGSCSPCPSPNNHPGVTQSSCPNAQLILDDFSNQCNCNSSSPGGFSGSWCTYKVCDTKCELDSLNCYNAGKAWNSQECRCYDVCGQLRAQCESSGGSFEGRSLDQDGETCCSAVCNRCNDEANSRIDALKTKYCCEAGFAPPAESQSCYSPPGISGCGMTTLQRLNNTLDYQCRDPNSSQEASQAYYDKCFPCEGEDCPSSSSSGDPNSSSGGGNSSSGGGSSGSNYPEGCSECPWLDSILDTLTAQKALVEGMYLCVVYPDMCNSGNTSDDKDSVIVNLDSNMLVGVTANQDSLKNLLRSIIDINGHIDTTLLSVYENLGGSSFDTTLRKVVQGGFSSVDTSLGRINGNINSMDANNRNRLDSILGRIPAHVFDSIRKYQGASIDRLDTLLFGRGAGFSMVDSLTDTVRKYLKISNHYDSLYYRKFVSFDSSLGERLDNMSIGTDFDPLGYGDTATSNLKQDLFSISEEIQRGIASFDSSVSAEIDSLLRFFSPGGIDTGAVGFGNGWGEHGERLADSIARDIGWKGGFDGVNIDSVFSHSTWETSGVDSVNDFVSDTLGGILDSLHLRLKFENDSIRGSLPDSLTVWADSLIKVSPFVSFDSLIYSTIGARIPNSDQCPEDCQSWSLSLPRFGLINYTVDFGLCLGRVPLGGLNVLGFLRLIIRLVIVWSCISIVMWTFSHRKM